MNKKSWVLLFLCIILILLFLINNSCNNGDDNNKEVEEEEKKVLEIPTIPLPTFTTVPSPTSTYHSVYLDYCINKYKNNFVLNNYMNCLNNFNEEEEVEKENNIVIIRQEPTLVPLPTLTSIPFPTSTSIPLPTPTIEIINNNTYINKYLDGMYFHTHTSDNCILEPSEFEFYGSKQEIVHHIHDVNYNNIMILNDINNTTNNKIENHDFHGCNR